MGRIQVRELGKAYKLYHNRWHRLREWLTPGRVAYHHKHWVLRGLNFDVEPGETVGVVGRNGAGKSTLLKLLTGTTRASEGEIRVEGRIAALLELGMGFHPEFTGRQNLYMAGQLLGMSQEEIGAHLQEIQAFAEIGEAFDQPVRTYSSGMQVRLAFSLATAVQPDILIVDEALAVGDASFQHKCYQRIRKFRDSGVTLLFVSHDPLAVKSLCDRAILLDQGRTVMDGPPDAVLDYYNALIALEEESAAQPAEQIVQVQSQTRSGNRSAQILQVGMVRRGQAVHGVRVGDPVTIRVEFEVRRTLDDLTVGILIRDRLGNDIYGTNTYHLGVPIPGLHAGRRMTVEFAIPSLRLGPGSYSLTVALHAASQHLEENYDWWDQALSFEVGENVRDKFIGVVKLDVIAHVLPGTASDA